MTKGAANVSDLEQSGNYGCGPIFGNGAALLSNIQLPHGHCAACTDIRFAGQSLPYYIHPADERGPEFIRQSIGNAENKADHI